MEALPGRAVLIGDVATVAVATSSASVISGSFFDRCGPPIAFIFPYGSAVLWGFTEVRLNIM